VRKNSADLTYERIKQKIIEGEYHPSQRLIEATLAESLSVSRHNVRVALDRLQSDGLVHIEPNRGATVTALDLEDVLDILMAREALEAEVTRLAAEQIKRDQVQHLEVCLETMREALTTVEYDRYSATNRAFHQVIYEASGNQTIPELINLLRLRLARLQLRTFLIPGRSEQSLAEHEAILQAIRAKDPTAAERAARAHLINLRVAIQKAWNLVRI
jgi:DNA-binding GntR family transcriptional regulator